MSAQADFVRDSGRILLCAQTDLVRDQCRLVGARKPVVESLALSTEASRHNTGLEFSFAFFVNPKVLSCASR